MRRVTQNKAKANKFIFPFVIILILAMIFFASFIITYNASIPKSDEPVNIEQGEEYQQPEDMLGSKTEEDKLSDLRKQNAELKKQVSDLEVENAQLRAELEELTATLENQSFVQQNGSTSSDENEDEDEPPITTRPQNNTPTSNTGI